jgi:aromatic-L-amino-acid decarboxylase
MWCAQVVDMICDYYKSLESYPVRSQVQPGYLRKLLPASAPKQPDQWQDVIKDFKDILMPGGPSCDGIKALHGTL